MDAGALTSAHLPTLLRSSSWAGIDEDVLVYSIQDLIQVLNMCITRFHGIVGSSIRRYVCSSWFVETVFGCLIGHLVVSSSDKVPT